MKFHIYRDHVGHYRWRLVARNGKTVADSGEGYKRRASCLRTLESMTRHIATGADVKLEDGTYHIIVMART